MHEVTASKMVCIVFVACLTMAIPSAAQTFHTLVNFDNSNGSSPQLPPVQGVDGNLYGVTFSGGLNGRGTVYQITPDGMLRSLYNFCSQPQCTDGEFPFGALVPGSDGNLYGITLNGGAYSEGTAFKLTLQGQLTSVYTFCSQANCADGAAPNGLLIATDGNFYGTTMGGGGNGGGTVFKLTPQGALTVLYNFCSQINCADGYDSNASSGTLTEGTDGNFYGLTDVGGSRVGNCSPLGCGTAYKITPQGKFTTLYTFCSLSNCAGAGPYWLMQAADGFFYGVTGYGGPFGGTIFKLTSQGKLTTLYSFCAKSGCTDGKEPIWLVQAAGAGAFYGATFRGGSGTKCRSGCGTVFEIPSRGSLTSLHSFDLTDGSYPYGLAQATNGTFYGITSEGGADGYGTVFSLATGLAPFVESLPTSGKVGAKVLILGTDLTGATEVSFNGTAATFTVVSATEIAATVPSGATTGSVLVTTPSGTLKSNVVFRVRP